ncbi:unnamed protein product [Brachionus calyciflorus]|uniref:Uncharacterized protein n=1 Tax=Brachionus calyciflorus TaxID=104777 RepID=A0A813M663_9BILA|nr:unnamed protein product [Brachionus calyciflorus]
MNSNLENDEINGQNLIKLIDASINSEDCSKKIKEYDIMPILEDPTEFYRIEQNHYLLINKLKCKQFYIYWRKKYFDNKNSESDDLLNSVSKCVLLINPNFASAWSKRKDLLLKNRLYRQEMEFNDLILIKNFKCEQAYIHRRWLMKRILSLNTQDNEILFLKEIDFMIDTLSCKIKSNYYCWSYFNWIVEYFYSLNILSDFPNILINLLEKFGSLVYRNPSDNCVFHARLNIFKVLFFKFKIKEIENLIVNELKQNLDLIMRFPNFITTWNYCKYFLLLILKVPQTLNNLVKEIETFRDDLANRLPILYPSFISKDIQNLSQDSIRDFFIDFSGLVARFSENSNETILAIMNSLSKKCQEAKEQYDACFNKWFSEKYLKGNVDDKECEQLFKIYQKCIKEAVTEHKIELWNLPSEYEHSKKHFTKNDT